MASDYEVLLKRDNGLNKTVIITDCYSEHEARETAESMYGMEVLRVLWRGRTGDNSSSSNDSYSSTSDRSFGGDFDALGVIGLLAFLFVIYFFVTFWYVIIPIGLICFIIWSCTLSNDD